MQVQEHIYLHMTVNKNKILTSSIQSKQSKIYFRNNVQNLSETYANLASKINIISFQNRKQLKKLQQGAEKMGKLGYKMY